MNFSELIDIGDLRDLCESFTALTGAVTAIVDNDGNVLVSTGWKPICTQFHRVHPVTSSRCRESDTVLAGQLRQGESYNVYKCKNGLVDVAVPITIGGEHVANFFTGQFFFEAPNKDDFICQAREYGFDEQAYLTALEGVPIFSEDYVREIMRFFTRLAQVMGKMGLARERLKQANQRFSIAADSARLGVWDWLVLENRLIWDERMFALYGVQEADFPGAYEAWQRGMHPDDMVRCSEEIVQALRGKKAFDTEFRVIWPTGKVRYIKAEALVVRDPQGKAIRMTGVNYDITERKQAEEKLQLAATVFSHAREGIIITAADATIIDVNDAFTRITGYRRDEVVGKNPHLLNSGQQDKAFYQAMWHDLTEKGHWYGEICNRRKNGDLYTELLTISSVRNARGTIQNYLALFSDITLLKAQQKQLEHIAHYDALTSLPNRVLLADRLHQAMAQTQRRGNRLAVVFLDLDGFKEVNDHYGHEIGDRLLIAVSSCMSEILREGDTLARIGGDEFVAVLLDQTEAEASMPMLNRLLIAAAQPVRIGDHVHQVSASLGVAFYPQGEEVDADQLLRQADQAMYQAKLSGKNRFHFFDAEQDRSVRGHHESLEHIRHALTNHEFVLYYQPKVNMRTGQVIGAEALIRWQHPERGLLSPAVFLPVIEEHPLAVEVGEWVIHSALTQIALWQEAGLDLPVSVNIGAHQLQRPDFVKRVREILSAHSDIEPGKLTMEILETSALEDLTRISRIIEECRAMGIVFSLDDFGTGYSSLTYLKRLPVKKLKIDQSFVRDMLDDPDDLAILQGILGLATAFRRQVIAEGVETVEHGELLLQLGCELAQGYGIARPMPAAELPGWVATWHPDSAWSNRSPARREDLPLLFAATEHRAWITALENYLNGEQETPPTLDSRQCRFGLWLYAEGQARYGDQFGFQTIERLHRQIHAVAAELCGLHSRGERLEPARLVELHRQMEVLLNEEKVLLG